MSGSQARVAKHRWLLAAGIAMVVLSIASIATAVFFHFQLVSQPSAMEQILSGVARPVTNPLVSSIPILIAIGVLLLLGGITTFIAGIVPARARALTAAILGLATVAIAGYAWTMSVLIYTQIGSSGV